MWLIGIITAILAGAVMPGLAILFGFIINAFNVTNTADDVLATMRIIAIACLIVAGVGFIWGFIFYSFW